MNKTEINKLKSIINTQLSIIRNRIDFINRQKKEEKEKLEIQKEIEDFNNYNSINESYSDEEGFGYSSGYNTSDIEDALDM
jgi:hypothetical protein